METQDKEPTLEEKAQTLFTIQSLLLLYPDLPKMYPQLVNIIDFLKKQIETFLGDDEKMIVIARKNGKTAALVFNPKIKFSLTTDLQIITDSTINPLLSQYGMDKYQAKLMDLPIIQSMKERYEKMDPTEAANQTGGMLSMLSNLMPNESPIQNQPPQEPLQIDQ